jgi:hypothetical protein
MGIESLLWVAMIGTHDSGALIFGVMGVAVLEALCWGVFWSVRSRSQWNALLATFFSASVGAYGMSVIWNALSSQPGTEISAAPLRLLLAAVIGIFAVRDDGCTGVLKKTSQRKQWKPGTKRSAVTGSNAG